MLAGGLQLASRAGSEASTVMSARRCPLFLSTIGCAVEMANRQLRQMYPDRHDDWIQIRRFHVLREDFSVANGMLVASCFCGSAARACRVSRQLRVRGKGRGQGCSWLMPA